MEELIDRLQRKVGISREAAHRAVEVVTEFISREAPADTVAELAAAIPGLGDLTGPLPSETTVLAGTRHFGGMARLMVVADKMMAAGLTMQQVQDATHEVMDFARERAGEDLVNRIVQAIPGLRQIA
ncbi:MAG: DUF2267 domain-containing protein [Pseudomonadota bacterium]|nr:DUF2267 domain-containing protein [Hyphomicrobiales bacterium]